MINKSAKREALLLKFPTEIATRKGTPQGLIGLFGHTHVPDDQGEPGDYLIQYQFKIIQEMKGDQYTVQYYSGWDGGPTDVGVMTEAELRGPTVKLYPTEDEWTAAYEKARLQG